MDYSRVSLTGFTEAIASKTPTPGGGGAAALVAAVGIALGDMVGEYTVGKKKYAEYEDDVKKLMEQAQELRVKFLDCINDDANAYSKVSAAYSMDKTDKNYEKVMENALHVAADAPYKILSLCKDAMELQLGFMQYGSKLLLSDAMSGAYILNGAAKTAAVNVKVNTKLMKNRLEAKDLDKKTNFLVLECDRILGQIHDLYIG